MFDFVFKPFFWNVVINIVIVVVSALGLYFLKLGSFKIHFSSKEQKHKSSKQADDTTRLVAILEEIRRYIANEVTMTGGAKVSGTADVTHKKAGDGTGAKP